MSNHMAPYGDLSKCYHVYFMIVIMAWDWYLWVMRRNVLSSSWDFGTIRSDGGPGQVKAKTNPIRKRFHLSCDVEAQFCLCLISRCLKHISKFSLKCPIKSHQVYFVWAFVKSQWTVLICLSWLWNDGSWLQIIFLMWLISWIKKWNSLSLVNWCRYLSQDCGVPMNEILVGKFRSMKFLLGNWLNDDI